MNTNEDIVDMEDVCFFAPLSKTLSYSSEESCASIEKMSTSKRGIKKMPLQSHQIFYDFNRTADISVQSIKSKSKVNNNSNSSEKSFGRDNFKVKRNNDEIILDNITLALNMDKSLNQEKDNQNKQNDIFHELSVIIDDPIRYGYLLAFCENEHNSENLEFIFDLTNFQKYISSRDNLSWSTSWKVIDERLKKRDFIPLRDSDWPSELIQKQLLQNKANEIFNKYFVSSIESKNNILFLPNTIINNTKKRIDYIDFYGIQIFHEAYVYIANSFKYDSFLRFLNSKLFYEMNLTIESMQHSPLLCNALVIEIPTTTILHTLHINILRKNYTFSFDSILYDTFLFKEFLNYIQINSNENLNQIANNNKQHCEELYQTPALIAQNERNLNFIKESKHAYLYLLILNMISIFQQLFDYQLISKVKSSALTIYRYFLLNNSNFKVDLDDKDLQSISVLLAKPSRNMFFQLEKKVYNKLENYFSNNYKKTLNYQLLYKIMFHEKYKTLTLFEKMKYKLFKM